MPKLEIRRPSEVPVPSRSPRAVQEQQRLYEGFIRGIDGNVGELEPSADENLRSIKVRLRRAATRLGMPVDIWDADDKVYFKTSVRRGRPRKTVSA